MPHRPLDQDYIFNGVIYLKGETLHPNHVQEAVDNFKQRMSVPQHHDPIFRGSVVPTSGDVKSTFGTMRVPQEVELNAPPVPDALPDDLPYRGKLLAAGISTLDALKDVTDLTEYGLTSEEADEITEALK